MSNQSVWKKFDDNTLSHSAAHYLMTILELQEEQGYARATDVAQRMNITRGSCSIGLKSLRQRGLVMEDSNKMLFLTDRGQTLARIVHKNDQLLETFFRDFLGMDPDQAEVDACKIEHLLSLEASVRLCHFIQLMETKTETVEKFRKLLAEAVSANTLATESCEQCDSQCLFADPTVRQAV